MIMLDRFGIRSVPPCRDCWEDGQCSMNCGPKVNSATVKPLPPEPTPLHIFRGSTILGDRKGQPCRMLAVNGPNVHIEFEDGFKAHVPFYLVRRKRGAP